LRDPHPGWRAHLRGRRQPRQREARRHRSVAGLALALALLCRHRPVRLARRAHRRRDRLSDFVAALSGDRSGLKARLASAPLKLAFDGTVANRTSMMMEGTLTIDSASLRDALQWTGQAPPGSGGFGRFTLKA